jgi:hypothetical protein
VKRHRIVFALTVSLAAALLAPGLAGARVIHFKGHAIADPATQVTFDMKGFVKQVRKNGRVRRRFIATWVSNVHVIDQMVTCYDANGNPVMGPFRFTSQYPFYEIPPMKVVKPSNPRHGRRFSGKYVYPPTGDPTTANYFAGFFPKGKPRRVTGHFLAQYDPGGISFGYCGNKEPEPWTGRFSF